MKMANADIWVNRKGLEFLYLRCKQQLSQQEIYHKHDNPKVSLLQEKGAYPVGGQPAVWEAS